MTVLEQRPAEGQQEQDSPVLRTGRLVLRAPRADDADALAGLINDIRIAENTARVPHPYGIKDAQQFIDYARSGGREIALLAMLPDETIVGGCGIGTLRGSLPEIGYWFGVRYWGRGYATEAARAVIDHAFQTLGHDVLVAGARVSNPASRRVLEKCGYQWTGVVLQRVRALGWSVPCDRFRLTREQWAALKASVPIERAA